ncbi:hypothetical protein HNY73_005885 [Argiope bruennichi]|uniref:Uncharacterized protein n=1 Tax=Argiope bruennichi TaxID=94029 RepID=A0A8T0FJ39_ARGBR|nr:hypothetical protein HNY73_005885 [Argiope bruennichi]
MASVVAAAPPTTSSVMCEQHDASQGKDCRVTKRCVCTTIARLSDRLGLLGPVVTKAQTSFTPIDGMSIFTNFQELIACIICIFQDLGDP